MLASNPAVRRLFDGTIDREGYARFLAQTWLYVRETTPLLAQAGQRLMARGQHPVFARLLCQKAGEERGHERWIAADLRQLGWPTGALERTVPSFAVAAYLAWNRYTVKVGLPLAFLGTAYMLEALSVAHASQVVERLLERRAIPNIEKAVTFLRGHSDADPGHVEQLAAALGAIGDGEEREAILLSARTTRVLYAGLCTEVCDASGTPGGAALAA